MEYLNGQMAVSCIEEAGECSVGIGATKVGFIPTLVENLVQITENENPLLFTG